MKSMHAIGIFEQVAITLDERQGSLEYFRVLLLGSSMKCGGRIFIYYSCHVDWAWRTWRCFSVVTPLM